MGAICKCHIDFMWHLPVDVWSIKIKQQISHMQSHRTANYVACHNCNSPQSFQQCMQKPKEHLQLSYTAKQLKASSQHWSLICAVCLVYYHSLLKVQTDSLVLLSEVLLKCVISGVWCLQCRCPVWSGYYKQYHMQYLLHWRPATVHRLTPWISQPRCRGCICCLPGENLRHSVHSNVMYLCSFLDVVSFSDLHLLQNTHNH